MLQFKKKLSRWNHAEDTWKRVLELTFNINVSVNQYK